MIPDWDRWFKRNRYAITSYTFWEKVQTNRWKKSDPNPNWTQDKRLEYLWFPFQAPLFPRWSAVERHCWTTDKRWVFSRAAVKPHDSISSYVLEKLLKRMGIAPATRSLSFSCLFTIAQRILSLSVHDHTKRKRTKTNGERVRIQATYQRSHSDEFLLSLWYPPWTFRVDSSTISLSMKDLFSIPYRGKYQKRDENRQLLSFRNERMGRSAYRLKSPLNNEGWWEWTLRVREDVYHSVRWFGTTRLLRVVRESKGVQGRKLIESNLHSGRVGQ